MKTLAIFAVLALMAGCATCDRHPVACGVGMALAVGSVAAVAATHHKVPATTPGTQTAPGGNLL